MSKKLIVVLTVLLISFTCFSSEPGKAEKPPVVVIEVPQPISPEPVQPLKLKATEPVWTVAEVKQPEPIPAAPKEEKKPLLPLVENENNNYFYMNPPEIVKEEIVIEWPTVQPTPTPEPVIMKSETVDNSMWANVPYQVNIKYTPLTPQPFEYSYVTCLPYDNYGTPYYYYSPYYSTYVPNSIKYPNRVRTFLGAVLCTPINGVQYVTNGAFNIVKKTFGLLTVDCPNCPKY